MQLEKNWMAVSKHWCKLELDPNKHEDLKSAVCKSWKGGLHTPSYNIEIAKAQ
jgi:hypothetical protein